MNKHQIIILLRLFLGFIFFSSGMSKLLDGHFPGIIGPVWLEQELSKYHLGLYARFIAYSQVVIGLLVLTQRFALIGSIMMVPLILNTLIVTISLEWRGTPYILTFFLILNIILLWYDLPKLLHLFPSWNSGHRRIKPTITNHVFWIFAFCLIVISPVLYHFQPILTYSLITISLSALYLLNLNSGNHSKPPIQ